ncbi:hypothetical protein CJD44_33600 [Streptomyces sp. alain-838]|nr:lantibiotic dehydratase [Streptomyces sp. alain-838]PAK22707.1 hypothetical protein CJD44_33600 [Streptomyces sp. alain-838]
MGAAPPRTPFEANDVFLYRAPLGGSPALPLPAAGPHDLGACAELLASVPADPLLAEALDLASPSLSALVRRVAERGAAGIKAGQLRRAALAVLRYDIRRRTRPTPFGLFAGVSTGHFDSTAKLERGPGHRTRTHVDMQWLTRLGHRLESDPAVLSVLTVQAHQALTVRGDRVVLTASSTQGVRLTEGGEARATVSVRRTPVVARALADRPPGVRVARMGVAHGDVGGPPGLVRRARRLRPGVHGGRGVLGGGLGLRAHSVLQS